MHPSLPFVIAGLLFGIGVYGVLVRRNAVLLLMSVELMLNAVNLVFVAADTAVRAAVPRGGQVFALFVIILAAAETGVGLAILLQVYRWRGSTAVDTVPLSETSDAVDLSDTSDAADLSEPADLAELSEDAR